MVSNIERDIDRKTQLLKKGIKDLQQLLGRVYTSARQSNNNKLIFIKRNVDKLEVVSRHINNLELPDIRKANTSRESTFIEEIENIYKETVSNIEKMQELLNKQAAEERKDTQYQGRLLVDQKNLDNLRLAHSSMRQMSVGTMLSRQDWKDLGKN